MGREHYGRRHAEKLGWREEWKEYTRARLRGKENRKQREDGNKREHKRGARGMGNGRGKEETRLREGKEEVMEIERGASTGGKEASNHRFDAAE